MDWEKIVVILASISASFAGITTGMKNVQEMKAKKRRPRSKKRRK